jgi:hypothetical protein
MNGNFQAANWNRTVWPFSRMPWKKPEHLTRWWLICAGLAHTFVDASLWTCAWG